LTRTVLLFLLLASPVLAQESHQWIMDDTRYRTEAGSGCCGISHCRPAGPGELVFTKDGYLHVPTGTTLRYGSKAVYPTRDPQGRVFICVTDELVCVFPGGST
jgi:hypothetical protein